MFDKHDADSLPDYVDYFGVSIVEDQVGMSSDASIYEVGDSLDCEITECKHV